jgi:hypothetical protein
MDDLWREAYDWCDGDRDPMWDWLEAKYLGTRLPPKKEPHAFSNLGLFGSHFLPETTEQRERRLREERSRLVAERR